MINAPRAVPVLLVVLVSGACIEFDLSNAHYKCEADGSCPSGLDCDARLQCVPPGGTNGSSGGHGGTSSNDAGSGEDAGAGGQAGQTAAGGSRAPGGDGGHAGGSGGHGGAGAGGGGAAGGSGGPVGRGQAGNGGGSPRIDCESDGWSRCNDESSSWICRDDACEDTCTGAPAPCRQAGRCGPPAQRAGVVLFDLEQIDIAALRCSVSASCPILTSLCRARGAFHEIDGSMPADLRGRVQVRTSDAPDDAQEGRDVALDGSIVSFSFCAGGGLTWLSAAVVVDGPAGETLPTNEICAPAAGPEPCSRRAAGLLLSA